MNVAHFQLLSFGLSLAVATSLAEEKATKFDLSKVEGFLDKHCYECHDDEVSKGDLDLFEVGENLSNPADFIRWAQIFERVEKGEMPPRKKARPGDAERTAILSHLEGSLATVERVAKHQYGRAELRRLSREEYANSLKDLLALPHIDFAEMLPPDGIAGHHRKSAAALDFSHVTVSR